MKSRPFSPSLQVIDLFNCINIFFKGMRRSAHEDTEFLISRYKVI